MIRTVPGGNVGPAGGGGWADGAGDSATAWSSVPDRPRKSAAPTTATSTSSAMPTTQPVRRPPSDGGSPSDSGAGTGAGGARRGEAGTAPPGPAGVATSDHAAPSHHRTSPGLPSGSGYQPGGGAGWPGPVTGSPLGRGHARVPSRPLPGRPRDRSPAGAGRRRRRPAPLRRVRLRRGRGPPAGGRGGIAGPARESRATARRRRAAGVPAGLGGVLGPADRGGPRGVRPPAPFGVAGRGGRRPGSAQPRRRRPLLRIGSGGRRPQHGARPSGGARLGRRPQGGGVRAAQPARGVRPHRGPVRRPADVIAWSGRHP